MQHLRDVGAGAQGASAWVAAPAPESKGKGKVPLDEALRDMDMNSARAPSPTRSLAAPSVAPSSRVSGVERSKYEMQQAVPDALAGLQPDMDPRLREVLEALDDEAYIDQGLAAADAGEGAEGGEEGGDAFFAAIARGGAEVSLDEFEAMAAEDEDDGWASDDTARPARHDDEALQLRADTECSDATSEGTEPSDDAPAAPSPDHGDGAFMASFLDPATRPAPPATAGTLPFRPPHLASSTTPSSDQPQPPPPPHSVASMLSAAPSSALRAAAAAGALRPGKKRRGAKTASEAYSMTSGSLARTEGLATLDARFERVLRSYEEEDEEGGDEMGSVVSGMTGMTGTSKASGASGLSKASGVSGVSRGSWAGRSMASGSGKGKAPASVDGLEGALDEFLAGAGGKVGGGQKRWGKSVEAKAARKERGLRELDEIRTELGPARV